jgi:hypothetical protein
VPVPGDPRIRASDADRDRAAALLREHHAAGRLTAAEFGDRMERALDATTMGQLDELMADLPAIDLYEVPAASLRPRPRDSSGLRPRDVTAGLVPREPGGDVADLSAAATAVVAWVTVATSLVVIGLVTGILIGGLSPWWLFAVIPAGAIALIWFLIRRSQR